MYLPEGTSLEIYSPTVITEEVGLITEIALARNIECD